MTTETIETVRDSVKVFLHFNPRDIRRATYVSRIFTQSHSTNGQEQKQGQRRT